MKDKLNRIRNNPKFKQEIDKLKPKRNIWGLLGVILFFFLPELLNILYYKEINIWIYNYALNAPNQQMADLLIWLGKKSFDGELSYINIALGVIFLIWLFKKD